MYSEETPDDEKMQEAGMHPMEIWDLGRSEYNNFEGPPYIMQGCQFFGNSLNSGPCNLFSDHMFQFFLVPIDRLLDSFQAHSCFLTGNPDYGILVKSKMCDHIRHVRD